MESEKKLESIPGHKFLALTLRPGDFISIGGHCVMVRRVRGAEVRLIISAPPDILVRLHKYDKVKDQGD